MIVLFFLLLGVSERLSERAVVVGSKTFTESVILGDITTRYLAHRGIAATHKREVGGSRVLFDALLHGDIDAYPEYTGTISQELLRGQAQADLNETLRDKGIVMVGPLGFNNTYAIGLLTARAQALGLKKISDLAKHPSLRFGFSNEFMARGDGWPSLREAYALPQREVRGLDHDLAYRALADGHIDATDLYSTDAEIEALKLAMLDDDRHHFTEYQAVLLVRADAPHDAASVLEGLRGQISATDMIALNAAVRMHGESEAKAANDFVSTHILAESPAAPIVTETIESRIWQRTKEHLALVGWSLLMATLFAVPLGIVAARHRRVGQLLLAFAGLVQTIPSLALLVLFIPLLGIGSKPALAALFLYSLLPIVRNTYLGLVEIPAPLRDSAEVLGLGALAKLRYIELPLAAPAILTGLKTAAVINIGTATLGALVGAGGYGQPILTGIRLANVSLIMQGAIPAALMALVVQALFELVERQWKAK